MANIEIYSSHFCGYCAAAKTLLNSKGAQFTEYPVDGDPERRREMMERSGRGTVPQIFIDSTHVGGFDDLHALEQSGGLDGLLGGDC